MHVRYSSISDAALLGAAINKCALALGLFVSGGTKHELTHWEIVLVCLGVSILVILTVVGNLLVLVSFKVEKRLQTVSNYFLLSLAIADFLIG